VTRALPLLIALALFAFAPPLAAKPESVAMTQFRKAKKRYDQGAYREALDLFQLAWEHSHSPNARLYVARCFKQLDNLVAAYDEFRGTLRDAADKTEKDEKYVDTRNAAAAEIALLEPKLGRLVISVDDAMPGVAVTLDERPIPAISLGEPMTVTPGTFVLVARADGKKDVRRSVTVAPGKTVTVAFFFDPPAATPGAPSAVRESEPPLSPLQLAGWTVLGIGGASLVAAAATGAAAAARYHDLEDACPADSCTDTVNDVVSSGETFELVAYVTLGAGAAAVLAGALMVGFGGDEDESRSGSSVHTAVVPLPGGAVLAIAAAF
jgi:hypothetical protein